MTTHPLAMVLAVTLLAMLCMQAAVAISDEDLIEMHSIFLSPEEMEGFVIELDAAKRIGVQGASSHGDTLAARNLRSEPTATSYDERGLSDWNGGFMNRFRRWMGNHGGWGHGHGSGGGQGGGQGQGQGQGGGGMGSGQGGAGGMGGGGQGVGQGGGSMGGGMMMGGLTGEEHGVIMDMLQNRGLAKRSVKKLYDKNGTWIGMNANTTSTNDYVAKLFQTHVKQMMNLIADNRKARQGDPLYVELFSRTGDMDLSYTNLKDGISVVEKGKTQCAVELIEAHTKVVSGFISKGHEEVRASHAVPTSC